MLFQTDDEKSLRKVCEKEAIELKEVQLGHVIIVDNSCLLAPRSAEEYQEEYDQLRVNCWQTIERSPRFYAQLQTNSKRRDYAKDREVGFTTTARFSMASLAVVVVEISNKKLPSIDYQAYNIGLKEFFLNHPEITVVEYETIKYC